MTSYRAGARTGLAGTRLADGRVLSSKAAVAQLARRHIDTIRRYCVPVACDVGTRAELYDLNVSVGQFKVMNRACVITIDDCGALCGSAVMTNSPLPVCAYHAAVVSEFFIKQDKLELMREAATETATPGSVKLPVHAVVYYVQVDAAVKIGTTTNLAARMKTYPPHARLLATEPGGYSVEAKRLRQFNEYLRSGREWFDPGPRLRTFIEGLMEQPNGTAA